LSAWSRVSLSPGRDRQSPPFTVTHQYRPLGHDELLFVLERQWRKLGKTLDPDDFTDAQAIAAVERITRGNFRLLERLLPQIQRVLKINELDVITNDVVEAARSNLVIGTT
jgi:Holliday junction resolvasome RuvABC ATP-dependent DNA helicase subunit